MAHLATLGQPTHQGPLYARVDGLLSRSGRLANRGNVLICPTNKTTAKAVNSRLQGCPPGAEASQPPRYRFWLCCPMPSRPWVPIEMVSTGSYYHHHRDLAGGPGRWSLQGATTIIIETWQVDLVGGLYRSYYHHHRDLVGGLCS